MQGWTSHLHEPLTVIQDALEQAIADAELAKTTAQDAWNGQLLSATGNRLTYEFRLKVGWDVSENTRVVVHCDEERIDARVISQIDWVLILVTQVFLIVTTRIFLTFEN